MDSDIIIVISLLLFFFSIFGTLFWVLYRHYGQHNTVNRATQRQITDYDLLKLIEAQPDGLLTVQQLAEQTGMSTSQARRRLMLLQQWGILKILYGKTMRAYYSLLNPLDTRTPPALSAEPFLTVDDILQLFRHFDFRLSPQDLIMSTRLPANILKREMQYFQKEGVVQFLQQQSTYNPESQKFYVLQEPYRSHPEQFQQRQASMDLQLKTLLRKEDLI